MGGYGTITVRRSFGYHSKYSLGKGRHPAKGGRKPKEGGAVRDPQKREQHRLAEMERRKKHRQLFHHLVQTVEVVKPDAYMAFNNKKSKKNNLTVSINLLDNQRKLASVRAMNLKRTMLDLIESSSDFSHLRKDISRCLADVNAL
jgi:hypothetical protein